MAQGRAENSAIGTMAIQPDCGSAANGTPPITCGFQAGMCPAARLRPRKQPVGQKNAGRSAYWFETNPPKASRWRTIRTEPTMATGPARPSANEPPRLSRRFIDARAAASRRR